MTAPAFCPSTGTAFLTPFFRRRRRCAVSASPSHMESFANIKGPSAWKVRWAGARSSPFVFHQRSQTAMADMLETSRPARACGAILVVDDDRAFRVATRTVLEDEGYTVQLAVNGEEALQKCATDEI